MESIYLTIIKPFWFIWIKTIQNSSLICSFVLMGTSTILYFIGHNMINDIIFDLLVYFSLFCFTIFLLLFLIDILFKKELSLLIILNKEKMNIDNYNAVNIDNVSLTINIYKEHHTYWGHFIEISHNNIKEKYLLKYDDEIIKSIPKSQINYTNRHYLILEKTSRVLKEFLNILWAIN